MSRGGRLLTGRLTSRAVRGMRRDGRRACLADRRLFRAVAALSRLWCALSVGGRGRRGFVPFVRVDLELVARLAAGCDRLGELARVHRARELREDVADLPRGVALRALVAEQERGAHLARSGPAPVEREHEEALQDETRLIALHDRAPRDAA